MKQSTTGKGKWGEEVARRYLERKGYRILFTNWRAERGDIDIIAEDGNTLVFVEVKSGSSEKYGSPELRITPGKKRQLYKLATVYLAEYTNQIKHYESIRFDAVIVDGNRNQFQIRHYPGAIQL